jgi:N-sulfoglucosamine sulfohydrolase
MGGTEPHRGFAKGSGLKAGKRLADGTPPPFLPDTPEVRSDMLDYCLEIEWFDSHLGRALQAARGRGRTGQHARHRHQRQRHGLSPRQGEPLRVRFHLPLAIRWGARVPGGRTVDDLIGFVDLTATIYEATGVSHPSREYPLAGRSILNLLTSGKSGQVEPQRDAVFAGRERHSSARYNNWTYPQRAIRTARHLYIRNFRPDRWPAGDPVLLADRGKKGAKEKNDPKAGKAALRLQGHRRLADPGLPRRESRRPEDPTVPRSRRRQAPGGGTLRHRERPRLPEEPGRRLRPTPRRAQRSPSASRTNCASTGDARILDGGEIWETYPRYSPVREFPKPAGQ